VNKEKQFNEINLITGNTRTKREVQQEIRKVLKKKQIMELKHAMPRLEMQFRVLATDLIKQQKESMNVKTGHLKLSSQRKKKIEKE